MFTLISFIFLPIIIGLSNAETRYVDVARGKPATAGSEADESKVTYPIQGKTSNKCFRSLNHNKFWEVNLESPVFVHYILLNSPVKTDDLEVTVINFKHEETKLVIPSNCATTCRIKTWHDTLKIRVTKKGNSPLILCNLQALTEHVELHYAKNNSGGSIINFKETNYLIHIVFGSLILIIISFM